MIIVNFKNHTTKTAYGLWQWDYGQVLRIEGLDLPTATEVHFSTQETGMLIFTVGLNGLITREKLT